MVLQRLVNKESLAGLKTVHVNGRTTSTCTIAQLCTIAAMHTIVVTFSHDISTVHDATDEVHERYKEQLQFVQDRQQPATARGAAQ